MEEAKDNYQVSSCEINSTNPLNLAHLALSFYPPF